MAEDCALCGAALADSTAFCTTCGAPRSDASATKPARRFCTKCGTPLVGQARFCNKCGAATGVPTTLSPSASTSGPVEPATAQVASAMPKQDATAHAPIAASVTPVPVSSTPAVSPRAMPVHPRTSSGTPKIAATVVALVLVLIVGVAGVTYIVHRARQKVAELETRAEIQRSIGGTKGRVSSAHNDANSDRASAAGSAPGHGQASSSGSGVNAPQLVGAASSMSSTSATLDSVSTAGSQTANAAAPTPETALIPPPIPGGNVPVTPVAATGDQAHDWGLEYERTVGGPEADLVVRTGDINNLGFGWPAGFDPFSGQSTPIHPGPKIDRIPPNAPPGTDRVLLGTGITPVHMSLQQTPGKPDQIIVDALTKTIGGDGYSWSLSHCYMLRDRVLGKLGDQTTNVSQLPPGVSNDILQVTAADAADCTRERQLTMPTPIVLPVGTLPSKINAVVFQIFVDDFQSPVYGSHFQIGLNDTRIPTFEYAINSLNQSGPIGKLLSLKLLPEYWALLKSGTVKLWIDDPSSHVQDGFAVDFVRILVNPHNFKYQVSLTSTVTDAGSNKPIAGAIVTAGLSSALTDEQGKCALNEIPAGLVVATANAPGYDENSVPVDLPAGQRGNAEIQLRRHQENTADLEQSIAQTGTATIYGIHFDTGSSKLRADSLPALNAVLGLISGRSGSKWVISGHTDNQGSDALNIPLSKSRAASVISWLTAHGITSDRLEPEGFGSTRPVADNATAGGRALNRRVEVSLSR